MPTPAAVLIRLLLTIVVPLFVPSFRLGTKKLNSGLGIMKSSYGRQLIVGRVVIIIVTAFLSCGTQVDPRFGTGARP
ncbi:hypothetical protein BDW74DRAFT_156880 [Aspergillus multicolor]|uniref:uncharacterized protein n=1 Tax=Aspergillus multicolor TaxID=41759 RepID=UPI003CCD9916